MARMEGISEKNRFRQAKPSVIMSSSLILMVTHLNFLMVRKSIEAFRQMIKCLHLSKTNFDNWLDYITHW